MYSLHNRAAMMDHFVQGDRQGVFAPEHDHTEGIAHQHHIDPGPIHNTGDGVSYAVTIASFRRFLASRTSKMESGFSSVEKV